MADHQAGDTEHLDIQQLNELSARLSDGADHIVNAAAAQLKKDILSAARIASDMASLRLHIREIAASCTDEKAARLLQELVG